MATIKDTIKIDGYDEMTAEQKLAALEAAEMPKPDLSGYIAKSTFDTKVSELAAANRRVRELEGTKLTEEERLENDRKAFETEKAQFNRERNGQNSRGKLAQAGWKPEDYAEINEILDSFDDADKANQFTDALIKMGQAQRSAGDASARGTLLGGQPPKGGVTPDSSVTFQQEYEDAKKSGNSMLMAKIIRKANEKGVSLRTI